MEGEPAVTLLHGFLGSPDDWQGFFPGRVMVPVDWLPRLVAAANSPYPLATLAADLNRSLPDDEDRTLIGYSMGGRIALHMLTGPGRDRWERAIIVSASPGLASDEDRSARYAADLKWAERLRHDDWDAVLADWQALPVFDDEPQGALDQSAQKARREDWATAMAAGSVGLQSDLFPQLKNVEAPILWLAGERDAKYMSAGLRCASVSSTFAFEAIPSAGHRAPWTNRVAFECLSLAWADDGIVKKLPRPGPQTDSA